MDKLVKAFVDRLSSMQPNVNLRLDEPVVASALKDKLVRVTSQNARSGLQVRDFDYVICTSPAPATARIDFGTAMPVRKYEALTGLSYVAAAKVLMRCRERHWETLQGIYGGCSITDLAIQQCWYPSDNSEELEDKSMNHKTATSGVLTLDSRERVAT